MGKKLTLHDPFLLSISGIEETLPEVDRLFIDYCAKVEECADKRASRGGDCDTCPSRKKCMAYFEKVSGLSAKRGLTPDEHQSFLKQFVQLMSTVIL